jgi:5'-nucleotidase
MQARRHVGVARGGIEMMRTSRPRVAALAILIAATLASSVAHAAKFRVLVGNDDGVGAEGIAELVSVLTADPSLDVKVFAPATNQSGTGDRFTTGPLTVTQTTTAGGYPATSVAGYPADGVLFGILQGLEQRPDLVVTGINEGQNIGDLVTVSGTVGAALWAARLGIPAFAVSQGLAPTIDYEAAAHYTYKLVNLYRGSAAFRSKLGGGARGPAKVLNINFPTCVTGSLRGVRAVPLGRSTQVTGYEQQGSGDVWNPVVLRTPLGSTNCDSDLRNPTNDLEAMNNGFASVTPLDADLANDGLIRPIVRFVQE